MVDIAPESNPSLLVMQETIVAIEPGMVRKKEDLFPGGESGVHGPSACDRLQADTRPAPSADKHIM